MPFKHRMPETLPVQLGERSYAIQFGADLRAEVRAQVGLLRGAGRAVAVLTDTNVKARQEETMRAMFGETPILALPPGEEPQPARPALVARLSAVCPPPV